eukprot:Sspe_Gene.100664::Locus_75333_Transcript_1_1_Confidence_1.000_Length_470::g.100664::m.100664
MGGEKVVLNGGCHCKAVRFAVEVPKVLKVWQCNCSICHIKGNDHFVVPKAAFKLLQGGDKLTVYRFNTMQAQHLFCSVCGVQSFYVPRSNPDGYGVNPRCIDAGLLKIRGVRLEQVTYDGKNWDQSLHSSGIQGLSKL